MKKVFLCMALLGVLSSCSLDDDGEGINYHFEVVPVENVTLPDTLVLGERYQLPIMYSRPTSCYAFDGFDYEREDSTRYVYVVNRVFDQSGCEPLDNNVTEAILNFDVLYDYTYIFNFYQGQDEDDEPIYLTKTVPVKNPN